MHIALLGSTSHVAKATMEFLRGQASLTHVARNPQMVKNHLDRFGCADDGEQKRILTFDEFPASPMVFDAIINCVGFGTPEKVAAAGLEIYRLSDRMDELCLTYLERNPGTVLVNFSSGAVYGTAHDAPISESAFFSMELNHPRDSDHYRLVKIHNERKHRSWPSSSIIDLRLFSFFSQHIDFSSGYLICEIFRSIRDQKAFVTDENDIVRDFVHPEDLANLMLYSAKAKGVNVAVDVFSKAFVRKFELLGAAKEKFGLQVTVSQSERKISPTGSKNFYASGNPSATKILGYVPRWSSLETVIDQMSKSL